MKLTNSYKTEKNKHYIITEKGDGPIVLDCDIMNNVLEKLEKLVDIKTDYNKSFKRRIEDLQIVLKDVEDFDVDIEEALSEIYNK